MMLVSIGAVSLTKEKAEQLVKELSEKGQVSQGEARSFVREIMEKGDRERQAIQNAVTGEVRKIREEIGFASKKDLAQITERLRRIEEHLNISFAEAEPAPENAPAENTAPENQL
jgi:polyhydroxyalkanoate synthesis regulator phasin